MNTEDLRQLYAYNRWANARVFDAAARLDAGQFTKDLSSSFPSVRDTLTHILLAEWVWLRRWLGESPRAPAYEPSEFADAEAVRARLTEIERGQQDFLEGLTDDALTRTIDYVRITGEPGSYPLGSLLQHVVNHSTYHRGQVTTMLRQLGSQAPSTDFIYYLDEIR